MQCRSAHVSVGCDPSLASHSLSPALDTAQKQICEMRPVLSSRWNRLNEACQQIRCRRFCHRISAEVPVGHELVFGLSDLHFLHHDSGGVKTVEAQAGVEHAQHFSMTTVH